MRTLETNIQAKAHNIKRQTSAHYKQRKKEGKRRKMPARPLENAPKTVIITAKEQIRRHNEE